MKKPSKRELLTWKAAWSEARQLQAILCGDLHGSNGFHEICGWFFNRKDVEAVGLHRHPADGTATPLITLQIRFKSGRELLLENSPENGYASWRLPLSGPGSFTYVQRTS